MKENCVKKEVIYNGKIIRVEKDDIELEDGHRSTREVVFNTGGVSVLAFDEAGKVILVKQFRYPSKEELYEIPGGKQNPEENFVEAGMRELEEESGYTSEDAIYFGYFYPTVAYCSEVIHLVLAKNCVYKQQHLDEGERVDVALYDYEQVKRMIFSNEIKDGKTIIAILKYDSLYGDKHV